MQPVTIRPSHAQDADAIARVHVLAWQAAYRGILPQAVLDNLSMAQSAARWKAIMESYAPDRQGFYVMETGEGVVGFTDCGPARDKEYADEAELYTIYFLPEYRGRGYGRQLFAVVQAHLAKQGYAGCYAWSLEKNVAAQKAYEAWGAEKNATRSKIASIGGVDYREITHQWKWAS